MQILLTSAEARVLGSVVEKSLTTPDYYPLSLHAIAAACNQKSNRDPVMSLPEAQVMDALDALMAKHLVWEKNPSGSRVSKYAHRLSGGLGFSLSFSRNEIGTLCTLMLRGPQTLGEIRAHTARLCNFADRDDVERTLNNLAQREDGPFVVRMAREPGRKEARYAHLLCGEVAGAAARDVAPEVTAAGTPAEAAPAASAATDNDRIDSLERVIDELRAELDEIRRRLDTRDSEPS